MEIVDVAAAMKTNGNGNGNGDGNGGTVKPEDIDLDTADSDGLDLVIASLQAEIAKLEQQQLEDKAAALPLREA